MERLRRECGSGDAPVALTVLQARPRHGALPLAPDFPRSASDVDQTPFYGTAPLRIDLVDLSLRLAREADRLVEAISLVGALNESLLDGDQDRSSTLFASFRERFGISLLVAQKAISARHAGGSSGGSRTVHSEVLAPFLSPRRQVVAVAFEDSIDEERDYTRIRRTFLKFAAREQIEPADAVIIRDMFGPFAEDPAVLGQRIQAYGRWGLLDGVASVYRTRGRDARRRRHDVEG